MNFKKKIWKDYIIKEPENAWDTFLKDYNQLIMAVISKLTCDYDDKMELYAHALLHLKKNNCEKLIAYFEKPRSYNFETWIAVVTRNCCMDWFRKEKGRKRLIKCIKEFPEIEQWIFRYHYHYGYSLEVVYQIVQAKHGYKKSITDMVTVMDKIDDLVQQKSKWNIDSNLRSIINTSPQEELEIYDQKHPQPTTISNLEKIIHKDTEQILNDVLDSLSDQNRLIIRLYYLKGLTLEKVARVLKMKNIWQVQRKLKKALKHLKVELQKKGIGPSDLDIF